MGLINKNTKTQRPGILTNMIEAAEVVEVILDDQSPEWDPSNNAIVGSVKARKLETEYNKPTQELRYYRPLSLHMNCLPVVGEFVLLIKGPLNSIGTGNRDAQDDYYISSINLFNETNANDNHFSTLAIKGDGIDTSFTGNIATEDDKSLGEYFNPNEKFIRKLNYLEGDLLLEGRSGHSIRFSSTAAAGSISHLWSGGSDGEPVIVMSNGHSDNGGSEDFYMEDINEDASTIMLTSKQEIGIKIKNSMPSQVSDQPAKYNKGQVILCADRLLFSSKEDYIIMSGQKGVAIVTPEWKADFSTMMDILKDLIAEVATISQGKFPTGVGPTGPLAPQVSALAQIKSKFGQLQQ